MARPTKYNEKLQAKADKYLEDYDTAIPSVAGLCLRLGINKTTAYDWAKQEEKRQFSNTLDRLQQIQEANLLEGGLTGDYNPTIAKLALANHGYSDKQELTGKDGAPVMEGITVSFKNA